MSSSNNISRIQKWIGTIAGLNGLLLIACGFFLFLLLPIRGGASPGGAIAFTIMSLPIILAGGLFCLFLFGLLYLRKMVKRKNSIGKFGGIFLVSASVLTVASFYFVVSISWKMFFISQTQNASDIPDSTVVWDKQIVDGETYLLVQNLVGFQDIMEGVMLFHYPNTLEKTGDKYDEKYKVFDEAVDDMITNEKTGQSVPRVVVTAKLDLKKKKVYITFSEGKPQTLDVSKYDLEGGTP